MVEYYQREAVNIPDVPDLVRQLLTDNKRNHLLYRVVPHEKVVLHYKGTWEEYPGIYIRELEMIPMSLEEAIPGGVGSTWQSIIQIDIITSDDSYINYPPAEPGELDDEATKFDGAEKVLNALKWIIIRILEENREGYESSVLPTFQWDDLELTDASLVDGGYGGVGDIWALEMKYNFKVEVVTRDG